MQGRLCKSVAETLLYSFSNQVNGYALGSGAVAVTTACLKLSQGELCAVLAHELGHLRRGDPDRSRAVGRLLFLNLLLVNAIGCVSAFFAGFAGLSDDEEPPPLGIFGLLGLMAFVGCKLFEWTAYLLSHAVYLALFYACRANEYAADRYAAEIGFKECLVAFLKKLEREEKRWKRSLYDVVFSTHPPARKRIEALEKSPFPAGEPYYPWAW
ncbi:peptidase M48 Ste24p [Ammonifex degensii KC4]|uniref:Peptidase M48 Ste24p n=1 Tax=Ammonifex degensii (strain DSM 10501 / KC4) TaxID=429009 RepID=C9RC95_AMMDK|nr:M48 family metalloprotease [Ammonifex degensii]ACX51872.1 peptidase M48 Ste24p [Ammonifex degensii KC4]